MKKQHIELSDADKAYLENLLSKGSLKVRKQKRALALLELDRGKTLVSVSETLGVSYPSVLSWRDSYLKDGLLFLDDRARPGRPVVISGEQRAMITALACSEAPEGRSRWSLRLLADKVVELGYCEQISYRQVGKVLKNDLKPHLRHSWCIGKITAAFLANMERVLHLYALPPPCTRWCVLTNAPVSSLAT